MPEQTTKCNWMVKRIMKEEWINRLPKTDPAKDIYPISFLTEIPRPRKEAKPGAWKPGWGKIEGHADLY